MEEETNVAFAHLDCGRLWRVFVTRQGADGGGCALVLVAHHLIGDGTAGSQLLRQLLAEMAVVAEGKESLVLAEGSEMLLAPSLETIIDARPRLVSLAPVLLADTVEKVLPSLASKPNFWGGDPARQIPAEARRTGRPVFGELDARAVARLRDACRKHETTVHGAICAATLAALRRTGVVPESYGDGKLQLDSPISLRRFFDADKLPAQRPALNNYIVGYSERYAVPHEADAAAVWRLAAEVRRDLHEKALPTQLELLGMLAFVSEPIDVFLARLEASLFNGRTCTLEVSNIGVLSDLRPAYGPFPVHQVYFSQLMHDTAALVACNVVSTPANGLTFSVSYAEPNCSTAEAEAVARETMRLLKTMCTS